jgi:hypothetical protein
LPPLWQVTVLNTGRTVPTPEESSWYYDPNGPTKLTGGVDSAEDIDATLTAEHGVDWKFDHVFVTYGKLRATAPLFVGRCGRFYSAGGMVTHDTWGTADDGNTRTVSVNGQVFFNVLFPDWFSLVFAGVSLIFVHVCRLFPLTPRTPHT